MKKASTEAEIDGFIAKYTPELQKELRAARAKMQRLVPNGYELVYDNCNALVFGFGPSERPSEALLSLAATPKWVTLCFLQGAKLKDPGKASQAGLAGETYPCGWVTYSLDSTR